MKISRIQSIYFLIIFTTLFSFLMHLIPIMQAGFPLNDGGLFYTMTQELQAAGYRLPEITNYNNAAIPFAYPPLGFYLSGLLSDLFSLPLLVIFQYLPLVVTSLTIPLFYLLARRILPSPVYSAFATLAYAFIPALFTWNTMGGGITRSLGLLFSLLAFINAFDLFARKKSYLVLTTAIFTSLTVLSHPLSIIDVFLGLSLLCLFYGKDKESFLNLFLAFFFAFLFTSPWWLHVLSRHGVQPYLAAFQTGGQSLAALLVFAIFNFTEEPLVQPIAILSMVGFFVCIARKNWFLPLWLILRTFFLFRGVSSFSVVPISLLFSFGVVDILLAGFEKILPQGQQSTVKGPYFDSLRFQNLFQSWVIKLIVAVLFWQMTLNSFARASTFGGVALAAEDRDALKWIQNNMNGPANFIVLTGASAYTDSVSEWFPSITGRTSLATVQGSEWLIDSTFSQNIEAYDDLQLCIFQNKACLESWAQNTAQKYDFVYIHMPQQFPQFEENHLALQDELLNSPKYNLLYKKGMVSVFAKVP